MGFTHLHVHTEYSLLDGSSKITEIVKQAKALGMENLAITDHGAMYGVIDFYKECKAQGIHPVRPMWRSGAVFRRKAARMQSIIIWCFWQRLSRAMKI